MTAGANSAEQQEGRFLGGVGDEAYGRETTNQLDSSNLWRTFFVGSGRQAPLRAYKEPSAGLQCLQAAACSIPTSNPRMVLQDILGCIHCGTSDCVFFPLAETASACKLLELSWAAGAVA